MLPIHGIEGAESLIPVDLLSWQEGTAKKWGRESAPYQREVMVLAESGGLQGPSHIPDSMGDTGLEGYS